MPFYFLLLTSRRAYYDPTVGRFVSEDPLGFDGGDVNLFAYVKGNPVNRIDPFGLREFGYYDPGIASAVSAAQSEPCGPSRRCHTSWSKCWDKCISYLNPSWTVPVGGAITLAGYIAIGSRAIGGMGAVAGGWAAGTSAGCAVSCGIDPCGYDF